HESWTHLPPDQDAAAAEPADRQAIETKTDTPLTRGELVVIIGPAEAAQLAPARTFTDAEIAKAFGEMPEVNRGGRRAKIKAVADRLGLPAKAVYDALERHKARR